MLNRGSVEVRKMKYLLLAFCSFQLFLLVVSTENVKTVETKLPTEEKSNVSLAQDTVTHNTAPKENITHTEPSKQNISQPVLNDTLNIEFPTTNSPSNSSNVTLPPSNSPTTVPPPTTSTTTANTSTTSTTTTATIITSTTVSTTPEKSSTSHSSVEPTTGKTPESSTPLQQSRQFDGPSFIGGIVLTVGLTAIGFIAFKFYKADRAAKSENYRKL